MEPIRIHVAEAIRDRNNPRRIALDVTCDSVSDVSALLSRIQVGNAIFLSVAKETERTK